MAVRRPLLYFLLLFSTEIYSQATFTWENGRVSAVTFEVINPNLANATVRVPGGSQTLAGTWRADSVLTFMPAVPFTYDHTYTLYSGETEIISFIIPSRPPGPSAGVDILPSNDTLPANHLKIYLVFNQPMKEGGNGQFLELWDLTENIKVAEPFLDLRQELWSYGSDTLTIWFDPGRIKRDLIPNKKSGLVLTPGHRYEIRVLPGWMTEQGMTISSGASKTFVAGTSDRSSPITSRWLVKIPDPETKGALSVSFDEPMDPITLLNYTEIRDSHGNKLHGSFRLSGHSDILYFVPLKVWKTGVYKIIFDSRVEDFAGNRFHRLFDHEGPAESGNPVEIIIRIP